MWGAAGPTSFDCSGLVQWAFAQAGVSMPRVAADQARTGPAVPVSELEPGDLLFYHTDPTDPGYISHVAIYLGNGWMIQAPQPGMDVEVVPASFGTQFAGAVRVDPASPPRWPGAWPDGPASARHRPNGCSYLLHPRRPVGQKPCAWRLRTAGGAA